MKDSQAQVQAGQSNGSLEGDAKDGDKGRAPATPGRRSPRPPSRTEGTDPWPGSSGDQAFRGPGGSSSRPPFDEFRSVGSVVPGSPMTPRSTMSNGSVPVIFKPWMKDEETARREREERWRGG